MIRSEGKRRLIQGKVEYEEKANKREGKERVSKDRGWEKGEVSGVRGNSR